VSRAGQFLSRYGLDLLIVLAGTQAAVATALRTDLEHPSGPLLWLETAGVTAGVLVLLARRQHPFAAPAATWLLCAALSFLDGRLIVNQAGVFVAGMGAAVLLGNQRSARLAYAGLAIVLGGSLLVVLNDTAPAGDDLASVPVLFGISWLVGFALRERTERTEVAEERARRAERDREVAARVAVAEERGRIARELHDVVAHAVSMMLLQVGAVRHRLPDSAAEDREALRNVEQAGRTALAEMRLLLGAMREDGAAAELLPHPRLADLDQLARDVEAAGLPVRVRVLGQPVQLSPGLDLSAYRILQEGLTNSLRHSGASRAEVTIDYGGDELRLEVRDDGVGEATPDRDGDDRHGQGLIGIRERVHMFGGQMSAGPAPGGGYLVRARLPVGGEAS
jgi:signal transduction histidine kinase